MNEITLLISLTQSELDQLKEQLSCCDCGSDGENWRSPESYSLEEKLLKQLP